MWTCVDLSKNLHELQAASGLGLHCLPLLSNFNLNTYSKIYDILKVISSSSQV